MSTLYSTQVHVRGGREGHAESTDGILKLNLAPPKELGGKGGATNPEQLFAAGYAACFESALRLCARNEKIAIKDAAILATVSLNSTNEKGYFLSVKLDAEVAGVDQNTAKKLVEMAHTVCPYSKAIRDSVVVELSAIAK